MTSTINENDEFDPEQNPEFFETMPTFSRKDETETTDTNDEKLRGSVRNKYKKKRSQATEEEAPVKKKENENKGGYDKKNFVRRISKLNITETNWNINQLGDISTYPEAMDVEAD